jgi:16S rRNA (uracil1498-N3)-methyltransferase
LRVTRIYHEGRLQTGDTVTLSASASHHLVRVLRCKADTALILFNGEGGEFPATLLDENPKAARAAIDSFNDTDREPALKVSLIQGISRGDHMDTTIQKATELGVAEIIPAHCARSAALNRQRSGKKHERWQQIAVSACEQSGRNTLPVIRQAMSFEEAIHSVTAGTRLVLDPGADTGIKAIEQHNAPLCIISGPEGGLTEQEISASCDAGFDKVRFGPRVLRTETAGPAFIAAIQTLWGDMG